VQVFRFLHIGMLIALAAPDAARAQQAPSRPVAVTVTSNFGGSATSPVTQK
jgi:hypothetical protein